MISPDDACATGTANASLAGVNMFVMFDRSTSMNDHTDARDTASPTRWAAASKALGAFFASTKVDLRLGHRRSQGVAADPAELPDRDRHTEVEARKTRWFVAEDAPLA